MLAVLTDKPFSDKDWIFEIKWDGYRAIAELENGNVNLHSRKNISFNQKFSPITNSLKKINNNVILDGEVVVVDKSGKSSFQLLQNYQKNGEGNLVYYVFDIIYLDGYDLKSLPLIKRKEILKKFLPDITNIKYSDHIEKEGKAFYETAVQNNLEGIIAKSKKSKYESNKRSHDWLKIKTLYRQEAIIGGFTKPKGSRKNIGAVVLGIYENNNLVYIGHAGGGFKESDLENVKDKLDPLIRKTSPFKNKFKTNTPVTWVEPKLVCEVSFSEWTDEGLMRQPVFLGLRDDKEPKEIVREVPNQISIEKGKIEKDENEISDTNKNNNVNKEIIINKNKVKLTNLDKLYWPDEGFTKGDLIEYYQKIAKYMIPYLKGRPESLNRHPNGIKEEGFFQKDVDNTPDWIQTKKIYSESNDKEINYLICNDEATLIYMANLGCIEINPWFSKVNSLENPDYLVIDLDPEEISFDKVVETALAVKEVLDNAGADSYCKTSGATGLHIYVPLNAKYDYDIAREFAHLVGKFVNNKIPKITSLERNPSKRKKKVYLDYLQNRTGQTLAAPYSVRPRPGATVATPLKWDEVNSSLNPKDYTIESIPRRVGQMGDIFKNVLGKGINIEKCIKKLEGN